MKSRLTDANIEVTQAIDKEAPPERIIRSLAGALEADIVNRDGSRGPDHKTRVQAASLLLTYRIGRPVERQQVVTSNVGSEQGESLQDKLKRSPALRNMLRQMVEKAEQA